MWLKAAGPWLQAYAIPSFQFDIKLYRTNRPPHSAVRAPGKFQSPLIMEHVIEHVAARLDMDPVRVREMNFMKAPAPGGSHSFVHLTLHCIALHAVIVQMIHYGLPFEDGQSSSDDWPTVGSWVCNATAVIDDALALPSCHVLPSEVRCHIDRHVLEGVLLVCTDTALVACSMHQVCMLDLLCC